MFTLDPRRVYLVMTTAQTLSDVVGFTLFIYYYVEVFGATPLQLVLAGTALEATKFVFEVPTGVLADSVSRRLSLIIGTGLMGVSTLGQSMAPDFGLILICQALRGFAYTFINGADKAWLADEAGEEAVGPVLLLSSQLGQFISLPGIFGSIGLALIDLRWPLVISGLLSLGSMIFLTVAMPERGFKRPANRLWPGGGGLSTTLRAGLEAVRQRPVLVSLLTIAFFVGAGSEGYDRLWQSHLLTNFRWPALWSWLPMVWFGLINLGGQVLSFGALHLLRRHLGNTSRRRVGRLLLLAQGLSLLGCWGVGLAGSLEVAVAAAWFHGVIGAVTQPLFDTWLTLSIPARVRATVLSIGSQLNALGEIAAGPGVGALGSAFGTRLAIVTSGFLLLPNLILYARLIEQVQPAGADVPARGSEPGAGSPK